MFNIKCAAWSVLAAPFSFAPNGAPRAVLRELPFSREETQARLKVRQFEAQNAANLADAEQASLCHQRYRVGGVCPESAA